MPATQKLWLCRLTILSLTVVAIPFAAGNDNLEWWVPVFFGLFFYVVIRWQSRCQGCGKSFTLSPVAGERFPGLSLFSPKVMVKCQDCGHTGYRKNRGGGA